MAAVKPPATLSLEALLSDPRVSMAAGVAVKILFDERHATCAVVGVVTAFMGLVAAMSKSACANGKPINPPGKTEVISTGHFASATAALCCFSLRSYILRRVAPLATSAFGRDVPVVTATEMLLRGRNMMSWQHFFGDMEYLSSGMAALFSLTQLAFRFVAGTKALTQLPTLTSAVSVLSHLYCVKAAISPPQVKFLLGQ